MKQADEYVYLGQKLSMAQQTQKSEIGRRFTKLSQVFKSKIPRPLRTKVYNVSSQHSLILRMKVGVKGWTHDREKKPNNRNSVDGSSLESHT